MRALGSLLLIGLLCLCPAGCSLFKKNKDDRPASAEGGRPPAQFPGSGDPLLNSSKVQPNPVAGPANPASTMSNPGALLAGRVIDGLNRPPNGTIIRCVNLDDKSAQPVDVPVTPEGYFTIQGLKSGTHYKLVARGKSGDKTMGGITYHTAPNIRCLIQVKEEFAFEGMPDSLPKQAEQKPAEPQKPATPENKISGPAGWTPGAGNPASFNSATEPVLPGQVHVPISANELPPQWPPTIKIPAGPNPKPLQIDTKPQLPAAFGPGPVRAGQARVPSCVLVGKQLVNFALNDINGDPWEFRSRKGKLALLDFWGTHCLPCRETMPHLVALQNKYGAKGLEVLALAYENDGTTVEQAYRILAVNKKIGVNYRQLLGAGPNCPVRNDLGVQYLPTLILVDEQGWMLWRHQGRLDTTTAGELDRLIQRRLGAGRGF